MENTKYLTVEDVLSNENMQMAIAFLKEKKNACGDDGIWLHDLESYWNLNGLQVKELIQEGVYQPQIVHEHSVIAKTGKRRNISLMSSVDRLLLRSIHQILQPGLDGKFSAYSFGFRTGKGVDDAVVFAAEMIEKGKEYIVKVDVKDYFDSINHVRMLELIREEVEDLELYLLIEKYIVCMVENDFKCTQKHIGLLQGSPLSPVLSNLYLTEFDRYLEKEGISFARFADDIVLFVQDIQSGCRMYEQVREKLKEYFLEVNEEKSGVFSAFSKPYLGYDFEKTKSGKIFVKKHNWQPANGYKNWHMDTVQKTGSQYHIISDGILTKRDFTLLFENQEHKLSIPREFADSINVYSNVEFGSGFFDALNRSQTNMNIFDNYGNIIGTFHAAHQKSKMEVLIKQVEAYSNRKKRLYYAKKMEVASLHNIRCNLKYYYKRQPSDILKDKINEIGNAICEIRKTSNMDAILLWEARSRQSYYECFNDIVKDDGFHYEKRTRRPPLDPINALISFGNMVMYQKVAQAIHHTSVDIRISFVHSSLKRYENLNLDIADIFKPVIVDRVIFTLINKRMISGEKHFLYQEDGSVLLNQEGKRIFISEFEKKMQQRISMKERTYSYEQLIYQEVRNLERSLMTDAKYKPYKYQM